MCIERDSCFGSAVLDVIKEEVCLSSSMISIGIPSPIGAVS